MKILKKKRSFLARLRNYFITGIVVLVPIGITLYLTTFFISISSNLIPKNINPNNYLPFNIPGVEIVITVIFTWVLDLSSSHTPYKTRVRLKSISCSNGNSRRWMLLKYLKRHLQNAKRISHSTGKIRDTFHTCEISLKDDLFRAFFSFHQSMKLVEQCLFVNRWRNR